MSIQVIQWNIFIGSDVALISDLLRSVLKPVAIVELQEVSETSFRHLKDALNPDDCDFSLLHRVPGKHEGRNRRMGVATFVFGGKITASSVLQRSVFPERTLFTEIEFQCSKVSVLNFHSLTGVDYKKAKSSNFASIADFLESGKVDFVCCDANEPKIDSINSSEIEFFDNRDGGKCAAMIFGGDPVHKLSDSFKSYLATLSEMTPASPLAISHVTGGKPRRYDHILHAPTWRVTAMQYEYDRALGATSDHAIVFAEFERC
ncbi:hypothetical protein AEP_00077 [Curvibacter sp. AEP1-3]|uniref:endonuclease/exonuclease/phosphatase family protein n=1 Tax=Curvibacter sp. AEP1-3 TaxID=1844971 RepID=UPI000B3C36A3|nr:endonuclease/exonuclease/phosphatase family protein [Curvibacter sp. AEP1-3]ARV17043.1 hypothetical protein AEP_00077 [Curvibacter sp. AEP1-3]